MVEEHSVGPPLEVDLRDKCRYGSKTNKHTNMYVYMNICMYMCMHISVCINHVSLYICMCVMCLHDMKRHILVCE